MWRTRRVAAILSEGGLSHRRQLTLQFFPGDQAARAAFLSHATKEGSAPDVYDNIDFNH